MIYTSYFTNPEFKVIKKGLDDLKKQIKRKDITDAYDTVSESFSGIFSNMFDAMEDINIRKTQKNGDIIFKIPFPGYAKSDMKITKENSLLVIENTNKEKDETKKTVQIPINTKQVVVNMENGLMEVKFITKKDEDFKIDFQ